MQSLQKVLLPDFQDYIEKSKINYCALTVFEKEDVVFSDCTHAEWLDYFKKNYTPAPIQEKILSIPNGLIFWTPNEYEERVDKFIKLRYQVCDTNMIVTFIYSYFDKKIAFSLGTNENQQKLFDAYEKKKSVFNRQFNHILSPFKYDVTR
jgi:hypothetical protein